MPETLGIRLEMSRRQKVMTQAELAEASGVSLITINRLENDQGTANPRAGTIRKIAEALDIDPAWLLFGDGEPHLKAAA